MNTKQVKCKVPTNLSHKPIIALEDYDIIESYFYNKNSFIDIFKELTHPKVESEKIVSEEIPESL